MPSNVGKALPSDPILCHYQPILSIEDQQVFYYETLVRQQNNDATLTESLDFLHTIENKRLAAHLIQEVFWQSGKQFIDSSKVFSINLPLIAALDKSTLTILEAVIRNSNFAERIIFEIQSIDWVTFQKEAYPFMCQLKNLGVRFAIDDFGNGKVSFELFDKMMADIIKIDGVFFKHCVASRWGAAVVELIVEYAKKNNLVTIAEEIDSRIAFENAFRYGVDMVQGFYIQRPVTGNALQMQERYGDYEIFKKNPTCIDANGLVEY